MAKVELRRFTPVRLSTSSYRYSWAQWMTVAGRNLGALPAHLPREEVVIDLDCRASDAVPEAAARAVQAAVPAQLARFLQRVHATTLALA